MVSTFQVPRSLRGAVREESVLDLTKPQPIVAIFAGQGKLTSTFVVYGTLLTYYSSLLKSAFGSPLAEGATRSMKLVDVTVETFGLITNGSTSKNSHLHLPKFHRWKALSRSGWRPSDWKCMLCRIMSAAFFVIVWLSLKVFANQSHLESTVALLMTDSMWYDASHAGLRIMEAGLSTFHTSSSSSSVMGSLVSESVAVAN
ncbi:hypothetical protein BKA65DRAFT_560349 [Rhexocercosporidium sp. MPI-PUGE-AT-0058]|nr:hypothetical protein BKA65DRAFT_560349 [Rhexocercosporidium sp. MPI-PUGE-AT-0058]